MIPFDIDDYLNRSSVCKNLILSDDITTIYLNNNEILHYQWILPNLLVIRDDLLCGGTKSRFLHKILPLNYTNYVYVSPWWGGAQIALSLAINHLNSTSHSTPKKSIIFTQVPDGPIPAFNSVAQEFGSDINFISGSVDDLYNAAYDFIDHNKDSILLPSGFDTPDFNTQLATFASHIKEIFGPFDQVWSVAGSGALTRGLQKGKLGKEYFAVSVDRFLPNVGNAHLIKYPYPFNQRVSADKYPPFPSASHYDAKAWYYAYRSALENPNKRIVFWNVM